MLARVSTIFACSEEDLWEKIVEPKSLQYVAAPILTFRPLVAGEFDGEWVKDHSYILRLYFFSFLPLGAHRIKLTQIDNENNTIISNESSTLVRVWNHKIYFHQVEPNKLHYTDEIEIEAGWLTAVIWAFAHLFYRHRQRRWKQLLSM